jgi:hypothetical protein
MNATVPSTVTIAVDSSARTTPVGHTGGRPVVVGIDGDGYR